MEWLSDYKKCFNCYYWLEAAQEADPDFCHECCLDESCMKNHSDYAD